MNEFRAPRWQRIFVDAGSSETVGDAVLSQRGLPRNGYNRWLGFCAVVSLCSMNSTCKCVLAVDEAHELIFVIVWKI